MKKIIAFAGLPFDTYAGGYSMIHDDEVEMLQEKIRDLRDELRSHGETTPSPKCAALCETSAEVLGGLETAFGHYIEKSEKVWQDA